MHLGLMFGSLCYSGIAGVDSNERRQSPHASSRRVAVWRDLSSDDVIQGRIECAVLFPTVPVVHLFGKLFA